jgi:hypothetical protein
VVHLLYRRNRLPVQQPHSVPLQFLSDTGLVGALLALAAFALLIAAGTRAVRRSPSGAHRLVAAALLGGVAAYAVHALYDWDWDIPGVTLPALIFLGLLAGRAAGIGDEGSPPGWVRPRLGWRALALAGATLWLCAAAVSSELPELASAKASSAVIKASGNSPAEIAAAGAAASKAARLDPLSDAGPLAEETVALHQGRVFQARRYLTDAVRRDPSDETAWARLVYVDGLLRDRPDVVLATQRIIELDPRSTLARYELEIQLLAANPRGSATSSRTPAPGS